jgi:spore cortex formation protein SpoVR/YcgB (stage V sporulation)
MRHVARLWGFTVRLETVDESGKAELTHEIRNEKRRTLVLS